MKYKLICFDMGGVLIENRNFWMTLHKSYGTLQEGQKLTDQYLKTDYPQLIKEVPGRLWLNKDAKKFYNLVYNTRLTKGIDNLFAFLEEREIITAIISASELEIARRIQETCGTDHIYANHLVIKNQKVDGEFWHPVGASGKKKLSIMKSLCHNLGFSLAQTIYVGNDEIDKECLESAGFPIAFDATPQLQELVKSKNGHVERRRDLRQLIPFIEKLLYSV